MGRPPSDLDDYLDWQERLESYRASGLGDRNPPDLATLARIAKLLGTTPAKLLEPPGK